jgi:enoyl-CoA hydratase
VGLPGLVGASRALDLILTGRPDPAEEAERIGVVTRGVPRGTPRAAAETLARELAQFPQQCLRNDRASALEQEGLDEPDAMRRELALGLDSLASGALDGAARFAAGEGRHGDA